VCALNGVFEIIFKNLFSLTVPGSASKCHARLKGSIFVCFCKAKLYAVCAAAEAILSYDNIDPDYPFEAYM